MSTPLFAPPGSKKGKGACPFLFFAFGSVPVGHEALGHVGQHGIIAELVDVDAVTAAAIRVEAARVIAQVRRDVDKPIARLLDGSLGRGVVAVDLIIRGKVRPGIDRRDRRDIQLCRRQLRLRIGKEAEVILAIGLLAGHVDVVHAHGEDDILRVDDLQRLKRGIRTAVDIKCIFPQAADADISGRNDHVLRQHIIDEQAAADAVADKCTVGQLHQLVVVKRIAAIRRELDRRRRADGLLCRRRGRRGRSLCRRGLAVRFPECHNYRDRHRHKDHTQDDDNIARRLFLFAFAFHLLKTSLPNKLFSYYSTQNRFCRGVSHMFSRHKNGMRQARRRMHRDAPFSNA